MRVATVDGLVTLYYDGSKELWNRELHREWVEHRRNRGYVEVPYDFEAMDLSDACKSYLRERFSWQQVIVVDGVTEIPHHTFHECLNILRVIFADTVIRIEESAFNRCENLIFIKWSLRLEYIGDAAFCDCNLPSVFIPPRCRQIGHVAFVYNTRLTIFNVSKDTELGAHVILSSKLIQRCPHTDSEAMNTWLKNINDHENFALHRLCSSFEPTLEMILDTMIEKGGLSAFKVENSIGISPSRYLKENPYAHVTEMEIIEKYFLKMTGEL